MCSVLDLFSYVSIDLSIFRPIYLLTYLFKCLFISQFIYLSIYLSVSLSANLPVYLSVCLSITQFIFRWIDLYLFTHLFLYLSTDINISRIFKFVCLLVYFNVGKSSDVYTNINGMCFMAILNGRFSNKQKRLHSNLETVILCIKGRGRGGGVVWSFRVLLALT